MGAGPCECEHIGIHSTRQVRSVPRRSEDVKGFRPSLILMQDILERQMLSNPQSELIIFHYM